MIFLQKGIKNTTYELKTEPSYLHRPIMYVIIYNGPA